MATGRLLLRDYFYAAIVFTLVSTGIIYMITTVTSQDNNMGDDTTVPDLMDSDKISNLNTSLATNGSVVRRVETLQSELKNLKVEDPLDALTLPAAFVKTSWSVVTLMMSSIGFMNVALESMSTYLGIPGWVPPLLIVLIGALLVFTIISLIFGKDI